jgi:hypothetical protein
MEEALRLTNGNKSAAARMLGLKRTTLVAKLRRKAGAVEAFGVPAPDGSDRDELFSEPLDAVASVKGA